MEDKQRTRKSDDRKVARDVETVDREDGNDGLENGGGRNV